jgi:YVTN family beta-propeller protein
VIKIATGKVVDTIRTGKGAHGVAVSNDGRAVFVTNIVDGTMSIIDTERRAVIAAYRVGEGPNGITFRPAD